MNIEHKKRSKVKLLIILSTLGFLGVLIVLSNIIKIQDERNKLFVIEEVAKTTDNSKRTVNLSSLDIEIPDIDLEITRGHSPLQNGWYNSNEVEVTITANSLEVAGGTYEIVYGIREKGNTEIPEKLINITEETTKVLIEQEGITEIIIYIELESNKLMQVKTLDVQIDRTPPTIESLTCIRVNKEQTKMIANNAHDNESGAGIAEYIFFVDNNVSSDDVIRTEKNETVFKANVSEFLGEVVVYDKAGNISTVTTSESTLKNGKVLYEIPKSGLTYVWVCERVQTDKFKPNNLIQLYGIASCGTANTSCTATYLRINGGDTAKLCANYNISNFSNR